MIRKLLIYSFAAISLFLLGFAASERLFKKTCDRKGMTYLIGHDQIIECKPTDWDFVFGDISFRGSND